MTVETFIGKAITELIESGVTIKFNKFSYVTKNTYHYFDGSSKKPILVINYNKRKDMSYIFPFFVHEYCHFLQWRNDHDFWNECTECLIELQAGFDDPHKKISKKCIRVVRELEIDCDKRAIELIKSNKLDKFIDIDRYIKEANIYVLWYRYIIKHRRMLEIPYDDVDILNLIPSHHMTINEVENFDGKLDYIFNKLHSRKV